MALRTLWVTMERPLKRASAGALWETTATRSSTTLSTIERGTCLHLGVAQPALGDRGHQLAGGLVAEQDGDPVHLHDLERQVHHRAEQPIDLQLRGELPGDLQQERELLGLPLLGGRGRDTKLPPVERPVAAGDPRRARRRSP